MSGYQSLRSSSSGQPFAHKPLVVVLRLTDFNILKQIHAELLHALCFRATVRDAETVHEARRYLTSTARPHAIIVADAGVTLPPYYEINHLLVEYAAEGGTVIYAGNFSAFVKFSDIGLMFKTQWGLPWQATEYTRSTISLSPHVRGLNTKTFIKRFTMEGLYLSGVAPNAAVYLEPHEINKLTNGKGVLPRQSATNKAAAAFAVIRRGRVGYVGDLNAEGPTTKLVLEMCFHPASRTPIAPGIGEPLEVPHTVTETPPVLPVKHSILVLSLQKDDWIDELYAPLYNALKKNSEMTEALTIRTANQVLSRTPLPHAILVSDAAITHPKYNTLCDRLVRYVRDGGIVVFGMQFSNHLPLGKARAFFDRWSVPWDAGSYHRTTFALNPAGIPAPLSKDSLQPSFSMKAVHVKNASRESAVYLPTSESRVESLVFAPDPITGTRAEETPAAFARVAQGYVGYVGDVNGEQGSLRILFEMCGVKVQLGDMGPRTFATGVTIGPNGVNEMMETEQEIPLPAPVPPPRAPGAREAEVRLRAEKRAQVREEKMQRADLLKTEGNHLFREEQWARAAEKYRAAALLAGPHPVYLSNLAACLLKLELWELADSAASRALLHDPKHVKALYRRAIACKEMERLTAAEHDIERLLKIDRTNRAAQDEREDIREKLGYCSGTDDWPCDEDLAGRALDAALPIEDESDSEDFTHAGNRTPCKFYNHGGCRHGSGCKFKHAPDSKSVRDELGRNVCVYWLVGYCRFDDRCVYAHDKTYLPVTGWWTDTGRLARLRKAFADAVAEDPLSLPPGASENILAEALKPVPWRKDLWAVIESYEHEAAEEERRRREGEGDGWETEEDEMDERMENGGWTNGEMEEMMMYGIKPWDIDAYDELAQIREALDYY